MAKSSVPPINGPATGGAPAKRGSGATASQPAKRIPAPTPKPAVRNPQPPKATASQPAKRMPASPRTQQRFGKS